MRALLLALLLASACTAAVLWQRQHYAAIRTGQRVLQDELDAVAAPTPSGVLAAGQAVLVIGRPAGVEALPRQAAAPAIVRVEQEPAREAEAADPDRPVSDAPLGEMELVVQPGQTLSGLAHLYYGARGAGLLRALADYNGLADPHSLRAGAPLRLPALETLESLQRHKAGN